MNDYLLQLSKHLPLGAILTTLKLSGLAITGSLGVLGVVKNYHRDNRLTFWGRTAIAGIVLSTFVTLAAAALEGMLGHQQTRDELARSQSVLREATRAAYPIDNVSLQLVLGIPVADLPSYVRDQARGTHSPSGRELADALDGLVGENAVVMGVYGSEGIPYMSIDAEFQPRASGWGLDRERDRLLVQTVTVEGAKRPRKSHRIEQDPIAGGRLTWDSFLGRPTLPDLCGKTLRIHHVRGSRSLIRVNLMISGMMMFFDHDEWTTTTAGQLTYHEIHLPDSLDEMRQRLVEMAKGDD